ncbi:FkbM family methyltransferase [Tateyamaria sp. SN6-1]|uniref:FkbM family methyltransferase n=1 Tax=Tateyamaria sp. SN6-1 TaxID=3092148 RepID=UPI0039F5B1CE
MIERTTKTGLKRLMRAGLDVGMRRKVHREMRGSFCSGIVMGLRAGLGAGDICVDLGANVGEITEPLATTGATVHAFEPDPDTFQTLKGACGGFDNVVLHQKAVAAEAGSMSLFRSTVLERDARKGSTGSTLIASNAVADAENTVTVDVIDGLAFLENLLDAHGRIAFLKMDIEGAELDLMERLLDTDMLTRIGLTVVETHRWLMEGQSKRYEAIERIADERPELNLFAYWT